MARIDLSEANGWVPEEKSSQVILAAQAASFVERNARRENMTTRTKGVPRFLGDDPVVVAEGATIPEATATLDEVILTAHKWAKIFNISEEDLNDSLVDTLTAYKREWASNWGRKFDHAALGVTVDVAGTDAAPYKSLYREIATATDVATRRIQTTVGGVITFENVNDALAVVETGKFYDPSNTVFFTSPKMLGNLRNLKDAAGLRVVVEPLNGTPGSIMGYPLELTQGAETGAAATSAPSGNPLLFVGNSKLLINGVRSGPESVVSKEPEFRTDGSLLKVRARRAFAVGRVEGFAVIEKRVA
jgi:HK97 family phage major capsid protein